MQVKSLVKWIIGYKSKVHQGKISYAQSGEDLIIDFIFKYVLGKQQFTYFDIGAHHSVYLSNTAIFYKSGMKGLSVEPDPFLHEEINKARKNEITLNMGVGFNKDETLTQNLQFYIMNVRTLNTFSKAEAERMQSSGHYKITEVKEIPVVHIHALFKKYFVPDFLSIDVEGIDFEILTSIDLETYRPKVICIETAEHSPIPPGIKNRDAIDYLTERDYLNYADTFNNTIFLDKRLLAKSIG